MQLNTNTDDAEYAFEEVQADKSAIQCQPVQTIPSTTAIPVAEPQNQPPPSTDPNPSPAKFTRRFEETKESPEDPPLFSQLRVHIILKGLLVSKEPEANKDLVIREYGTKYGVEVTNAYFKRQPDGSATAYVGFKYDYEAFKVITNKNMVEFPLVTKKGERGTPEYEVTELFNFWMGKTEALLDEQMRRYGDREKRAVTTMGITIAGCASPCS